MVFERNDEERFASRYPECLSATVGVPRIPADLLQRPSRQPWAVCHEHCRSTRRWVTVREMKESPSGSAIRC
jgi:hypothetical protein